MTRARASALALALLASGSCATSPAAHEKPRVIVRAEKPPHDAPCPGRPVELVEGPVPADAIRITTVVTEAAARRVSLREHEATARARAVDYCADGVSVLQAEEARGGVSRTRMVFWRNRPEGYTRDAAGAGAAVGAVDAGVAVGAVDAGADLAPHDR